MTLLTLLTLLLRSLTVTFTILLFYISFFLDTTICSIMTVPSLENSDHVTVCFHWVSVKLETGCTVSSHMTILVLIGTAFVIIWEKFRGKISLNSLLLLLVNFMSGFKLELSGILYLKYQAKSHTHLHVFQLLALRATLCSNHFFRLCQQNKSSQIKVQAS